MSISWPSAPPWPAAAWPRSFARLFRSVSDRKLDEMLRTLVTLGRARRRSPFAYGEVCR